MALIYLAGRLTKYDMNEWHGKVPGQRVKWVEFLVEDVFKMTYGELFLFQKTLMETGQTVLAETIPVKSELLLNPS